MMVTRIGFGRLITEIPKDAGYAQETAVKTYESYINENLGSDVEFLDKHGIDVKISDGGWGAPSSTSGGQAKVNLDLVDRNGKSLSSEVYWRDSIHYWGKLFREQEFGRHMIKALGARVKDLESELKSKQG